jgi:hypothetical protein
MVLEIAATRSYLAVMSRTFDFCLPTRAITVPDTRTGSTRLSTTATGCGWSATATASA